MNNVIIFEDFVTDAQKYETLLPPYGDSAEDLGLLPDSFDGENIYGIMPYDKWGNPWSSNYNSTYVVYVNFMGKRLAWHKWAVVPLMQVQEQLIAEGWDKKYYWTDLQTWNKRMIAGTKIPSNHAWPTAIDINPAKNPYRKDNKLVTDIPPRVVEIFKRYGFKWGGDYRTVKDAMHFEYLGEPVKDYVVRRILSLKTPLMAGSDVMEAQTLLAYYGYNIDVDGKFGKHSDACTRSFQASKMLVNDGIIGRITWVELLAKRSDRVLRIGTYGKDVEWIKKALNKISGANLFVDGIFGNELLVAIKRFQKENGLVVDGIIGAKTWKMLRNKSNPKSR